MVPIKKGRGTRQVLFRLIILLLAILTVGCGTTVPPEQSQEQSETQGGVPAASETEGIVTDEPYPAVLNIVENGKVNFRVVRPEGDEKDDQSVKSATAIKKALESYATDGKVSISTDYGIGSDTASYDILVGSVDFDARKNVSVQLGYGEYAIWVIGHKIVVFAHSDSDLAAASDAFINILAAHDTENGGIHNILLKAEDVNCRNSTGNILSGVPVLEGATLDYAEKDLRKNIYAYFKNVSVSVYKEALAALNEKGYTCFTSQNGSDGIYALYYNDSCAFQLQYNRSTQRITMVYEKRSGLEYASVFYGLITRDGVKICKDKNTDTAVSEKKVYDVVKLSEVSGNGWLKVSDEGEGVYCEASDVKICLSLSAVKREAAVIWARAIALDNDFHYGLNDWAHHYGCYFCGTNSKTGLKCKDGATYEDQLKTYCCNPFCTAAYCHGAGAVTLGTKVNMLINCKESSKRINLANDDNQAISNPKYWMLIELPNSSNDLLPGDVMLTPTHAMLYSGNGNLLEASGGDDNVKNSDKWNNSIRETTLTASKWEKVTKVYRYVGN